MIEAGLAALIAIVTGSAAITTRLHKRIDEVTTRIENVDKRVDSAELSMARFYVNKTEFDKAFQKMEAHMVRIEDKLDSLMMHRRAGESTKDGY